jgi:hypothetical protein
MPDDPEPPASEDDPYAREGWPSSLVVPGEHWDPPDSDGEDPGIGPRPAYLDTITDALIEADSDQPPPADFEG